LPSRPMTLAALARWGSTACQRKGQGKRRDNGAP
jgi:hypothetical protein